MRASGGAGRNDRPQALPGSLCDVFRQTPQLVVSPQLERHDESLEVVTDENERRSADVVPARRQT